jgi:hypothetical protein
VPSSAALADSSKLVAELFADDLAKATTADKKAALSAKMLQAGIDEKDDMPGKFTLLQLARELAIDIGDLDAAGKPINEMSKTFAINAPQVQIDTATTISKLPRLDRKRFATDAEALADTAMTSGEFDQAKSLSDLAVSSARQARDSELLSEISARAKLVNDAQADFAKVRQADATLKIKPNDPDANLKIGRFHCFVQDDWDAGLPNLTRGNDPVLKMLATEELKGNLNAAAAATLADGWWSIADKETGHARLHIRSHAGSWYEAASADLIGLAKVRAEKRAAQSQAAENQFATQPAGSLKDVSRVMTRLLNDPKHWKVDDGNWTISAGDLRGSGDCNVEFDTPLPADITLSFHINVIDGMRPRIHFIGTDMMFGNEGFSMVLFPHGTKAKNPPFPYKNKEPHQLTFKIANGHFDIAVDGKPAFTGTCKAAPSIQLKLSGGDSWSRGITEYSNFQVGSAASTNLFRIVPSTQPAAVASTSNQKLIVPAAPLLVESQQMVSELFADDIEKAATIDDKTALSEKLLQLARDERADIPGKYALFREAKDIAISAGELPSVCKAIDETAGAFVINPIAMKEESAGLIAKSALTDHRKFANEAADMADDVTKAGDFDLAKAFSDDAIASARLAKDPQLVLNITGRAKQITELRAAWDKIKLAENVLKEKPNDPDANLKMGRFLCFVRGDWPTGLVDLARGSDAGLKSAAAAELKAGDDPVVASTVADGWWPLADKETGNAKLLIRVHAGTWYEKALPGLTGLTRARAQKRLSDANAAESQLAASGFKAASSDVSEWKDLLGSVDLNSAIIKGDWMMDGNQLVAKAGQKPAIVRIAGMISKSYELQVAFIRPDSGDSLAICLPVNDKYVWLIFRPDLVGLDTVGDRRYFENETCRHQGFTGNQKHVVDVTVNPNETEVKITALVDDKTVIQWQGPPSRLDCYHQDWSMPEDFSLAIGSWDAAFTIVSARWKEISQP